MDLKKRTGWSHKEAKEAGLTRYIGRPCKNCDRQLRYTSSRGCVRCDKARYRPETRPEAPRRRHRSDGKLDHRGIDRLSMEREIAGTLREVWEE